MFPVSLLYISALQTSLAPAQGFSLTVTTHNSTALKVRAYQKTSLFVVPFGQKIFCIQSPDTKKPISMPTIFLSFFSSSDMHQSHYLNGCQFIYLFIYLCILYLTLTIQLKNNVYKLFSYRKLLI